MIERMYARIFTGMSKLPQIELPRSEYRDQIQGPLANPRQLRIAVAGFLALAVGAAAVAIWLRDVWWLVFAPIPLAMWAGASLAGLWPRWFFGNGKKDDDIV